MLYITGEIYGGWIHGIANILPDYAKEMQRVLLFSTSPANYPDYFVPGTLILSKLLPHHLSSPQTFLLTFGLLLGTPDNEVSPQYSVIVYIGT